MRMFFKRADDEVEDTSFCFADVDFNEFASAFMTWIIKTGTIF